METKKTKLTISGKPRKNLYDKQGLTNNKNKQKFVTEKKFSKPINKNNPGSSRFPKKNFSGKPSFPPKAGKPSFPSKIRSCCAWSLKSPFKFSFTTDTCNVYQELIKYGLLNHRFFE